MAKLGFSVGSSAGFAETEPREVEKQEMRPFTELEFLSESSLPALSSSLPLNIEPRENVKQGLQTQPH